MKSVFDRTDAANYADEWKLDALTALTGFAEKHPTTWASRLCSLWAQGGTEGMLRQIRNTLGPGWVCSKRVTLPAMRAELARMQEAQREADALAGDLGNEVPSMREVPMPPARRLPAPATFSAVTTRRQLSGRMRASCSAGNEIHTCHVEYDFALNLDENHRRAARTLLAQIGVAYALVSATTLDMDAVHMHIVVEDLVAPARTLTTAYDQQSAMLWADARTQAVRDAWLELSQAVTQGDL